MKLTAVFLFAFRITFVMGFFLKSLSAYANCQAPDPVPDCDSGCTQLGAVTQTLTIGPNEIYCVPRGTWTTLSQLTLAGGELRVCGVVDIQDFVQNPEERSKITVPASGMVQFLPTNGTSFVTHGNLEIHNWGTFRVLAPIDIQSGSEDTLFLNAGGIQFSGFSFNIDTTNVLFSNKNGAGFASTALNVTSTGSTGKFCVENGSWNSVLNLNVSNDNIFTSAGTGATCFNLAYADLTNTHSVTLDPIMMCGTSPASTTPNPVGNRWGAAYVPLNCTYCDITPPLSVTAIPIIPKDAFSISESGETGVLKLNLLDQPHLMGANIRIVDLSGRLVYFENNLDSRVGVKTVRVQAGGGPQLYVVSIELKSRQLIRRNAIF